MRVFVTRLAGGLVFLGGRSSYLLGGYQNTPLEPLLPVKLEPPPRSERSPVTFLLVLDRSASMDTSTQPGEPRPIELAREAAMRAVETLQPEDTLGLLTFSEDFNWDIPLRTLGSGLELRQALDSVSRVAPTGGTKMYQALQESLAGLASLDPSAPPSRHILILSDGQSYDGTPEEFGQFARTAQQQGITVSTIAFGEKADDQLLSEIAEIGRGRFYAVTHSEDLPRILVRESQAARSDNIQAGQTSLKMGELEHPVLSGLSLAQLPVLNGYNALTSKASEGAEDVLVSANFGDPILSIWQVGLGRVAAWTSDLGEEWTGLWASPEAQGRFWSQVVRYSLVNPTSSPAEVNIQVEPDRLFVEAALFENSSSPRNFADVSFSYAGEDGQVQRAVLSQVSPGEYRVELPRPAEGAYRAALTVGTGDGRQETTPAPFAVNPPAEWFTGSPGSGKELLASLAEQSHGQVLADILSADDSLTPAGPQEKKASSGLEWILLGLLVLWPLEIALRRRWMPWD